jgi:hypothetical protein
MGWIVGLIAAFVLLLVPELLIIIPVLLMEFILNLFGKSFGDKSKQ